MSDLSIGNVDVLDTTVSMVKEAEQKGYKQGRADALKEVEKAMYHQCFEEDNPEDMQKWDGGNWIRYKLFENVMEQLEEKKE